MAAARRWLPLAEAVRPAKSGSSEPSLSAASSARPGKPHRRSSREGAPGTPEVSSQSTGTTAVRTGGRPRPALQEHRTVRRDLLVEEARGAREVVGHVMRPGLGEPLRCAGLGCGVEAHEGREEAAGLLGVSGSEGETGSGVEKPPAVLFGQWPREERVETCEERRVGKEWRYQCALSH